MDCLSLLVQLYLKLIMLRHGLSYTTAESSLFLMVQETLRICCLWQNVN